MSKKTKTRYSSPLSIFTPQDICTRLPLYSRHPVSEYSIEQLYKIINCKGCKLDIYCPKCGADSIFDCSAGGAIPGKPENIVDLGGPGVSGFSHNPYAEYYENRNYHWRLTCQRDPAHYIEIMLCIDDGYLIKYGQYPSIWDIAAPDVKKYSSLLGRYHDEFVQAIRLASHGVGIGAFVYLRRIFENLLEEAHALVQSTQKDWAEEVYKQSDLREKISLLKDHLPPFLVQNTTLYSVLSKGLHELSEQECIDHFNLVKLGIEIILDQKLAQIEAERRAKEVSTELNLLHAKYLKT